MIIRRIIKPTGPLFFLLAFCFFLPFGTGAFSARDVIAAVRYVNPSAEVVLRTGQGTEYKIVGMVKDGDAVELLNENDSYAMVRLANGKEGWMLKRFLSASPPLSTVVGALRAENEELKRRQVEVTKKNEEASATLYKTETELQTALTERDQIKNDYENLQHDTANVIQIKEDMQKAKQENTSLVTEIASLKEENKALNKNKSINWFLAGGGVLLVGIAIGNLASKSRKRKSSLM
jgi:SH3 domain protein